MKNKKDIFINALFLSDKTIFQKYNSCLRNFYLYFIKKSKNGAKYVSVKQIQSAFSPEYPNKNKVLSTVTSLGYAWNEAFGSTTVFL